MQDWKDILYNSYKDKKDNFKTEKMNINTETLISIKSQIEKLTSADPHITDAIVSIQLKESDNKNFMYINLINR